MPWIWSKTSWHDMGKLLPREDTKFDVAVVKSLSKILGRCVIDENNAAYIHDHSLTKEHIYCLNGENPSR